MAHISNFFLSGNVEGDNLAQFLSEEIGLFGQSPESVQVVIHINSPGGDVLTALQVVNLIRSSPIPITTVVNGSAESAALLILMAGHRRAAMKNSFGMAHHFSTAIEGSYHDIQDTIKQNKILHDMMFNMWKDGTGLDDDIINNIMLGRSDVFLSAQELVKYNIVDKVLDHGTELLEFIKDYKNVPQENTQSKA